MDNWDEIKTAFQVAKHGTVSGAADSLGVHHATVIRHVDALEAKLGVKLFQRHSRGYTPTEAGDDLLLVAQATDDQFSQLEGRIKGRGAEVSGELVVTSLSAMAPFLSPVLTDFQDEHPDLIVRFLTGERVFKLEYGEAHVALRAGSAPEQPDNVVQSLGTMPVALYASRKYVDRHGLPSDESELISHRFVGYDDERGRAPFIAWMNKEIPRNRVVFRSSEPQVAEAAIRSGAGIGFLSVWAVRESPDLVQILPPRDEWRSSLWLVTHVDLHRTTKVQAFLKFLKQRARDWGTP